MTAAGQELEPRAFSPGPMGLNIAAATASYSTGDLVFDASLPLEDVTADVYVLGAGYQRFFGLFGRTAKFAVAAGWASGDAVGYVNDNYHERHFVGFTDPRIAVSWIFAGAPAMTAKEYAQYRPRNLAGFSVSLSPPVGRYEEDRLLNVGTNRWTMRTQLGAAHYQGRWTFEGTLGAQFFTDNKEFLGAVQQQEPIASVQAHVAYNFRPQLWVAGSATYYRGGESTIAGDSRPGFTSNSRYGLSASIPLPHRQSLGLNYSRGLSTRAGSDYDTLIATWAIRWLD
jgi:hypothetical protein